MLRFLKGVVAGSGTGLKDLPYNIGEPYSSDWGSWTHFRGTSKDDGSPVSIFSLSGNNHEDGHLGAGRNGVRRIRTVRHPNILSFLHSAESDVTDGSSAKVTLYIVTEPVTPLVEKIKELGLEDTQRDEYYAWGLHQIAKALSFLNNDCKLVHGNVCLASVVVTETLDWKLHAFDALSEFDANNEASSVPMLKYDWLIGPQYKPVELLNSDWTTIRKSPPWAIDSWGLGCLIYELFSGSKLGKTEDLRNTACIPKSLLADYQRLLSSIPSRRLNTTKLMESEFFQNKLVDTIHFMEVLNLKDSVDKDNFFRKLPSLAEQLPHHIVLKKLLPILASALEFGSAAATALTALLKMASSLSLEEFKMKVLPSIVKLFASNDRAIRVSLLQHIDQYGETLTEQVVSEQVYPHVAAGFTDTSPFLRELTLKSMLVLVPRLSQSTISGSLLKHLSKLQVDEEPAIRTNTTILLGNIASYLNEGTRKRVLINAFTVRALRDVFSPARGAGIKALCATRSYYDVHEIATRILPILIVLTVDPDSDVRANTFEAVDQFLQIIKQCHEKGKNEDSPGASNLLFSSIPGNGSLLGWAMSSLTLKVKSADQALASAPSHCTSLDSSITNECLLESRSSSAVVHGNGEIADGVSGDGWGELENAIGDESDTDKDGWGDLEVVPEEPKETSTLANIHSAQKRPIATPRPPATVSGVTQKTGRHEVIMDSEEDMWPSLAPPLPKPTSKPSVSGEDDPWDSIAAAPPPTRARPLSNVRGGRTVKPSMPKLGAQRRNAAS